MPNAFVLMTALPPTYGHLDLIQFAGNLYVDKVIVLLNTEPHEPLVSERFDALWHTLTEMNEVRGRERFVVRWQNEATQQEPTGPDDQEFWDDWVRNLRRYGFQPGDYIVASEPYGIRLAAEAGGQFMPYDPNRWVRFTKGTHVRNDHIGGWNQMIPHFRRLLQKRVTLFGAESTGKTTLVEALSATLNEEGIPTTKLFEWARPFLEMTGPEVTLEGMNRIWEGQHALQYSTYQNALNPLVLQDTDLYTTIGFWEDWSPETVPAGIYFDARMTRSDLYLITQSNIPFEHDILRYGGDERQTNDAYWIALCEKYELPYLVLDSDDLYERMGQATDAIDALLVNPLTYKRIGAEYQ